MQEVSGVYTSLFLHTDERKMALWARKVSGAFEKRAPGSVCITATHLGPIFSKALVPGCY